MSAKYQIENHFISKIRLQMCIQIQVFTNTSQINKQKAL